MPSAKSETVKLGSGRGARVSLEPGRVIAGKYLIETRIGKGGMGSVWSARHTELGTEVAVKVMLPREEEDPDDVERFMREARAASSLGSDHIVRVLDVGRMDDGVPYMVMERLKGEGLEHIIKTRAPLPVDEAVELLLQACVGIAEAHAHRIVHRDLKPSNIFVTRSSDGRPLAKVLDFGISKSLGKLSSGDDARSLTRTGSALGTPGYMSPEQLRSSKHVDARTDVWALGLILHKLLTGASAFDAADVGEYFAMIMTESPTPLRHQRPEAPEALEDVVATCLARAPEDRYQDVGQLARALLPFDASGARWVERIEQVLAQHDAAAVDGPRTSIPSSNADADTEVSLGRQAMTATPAAPSTQAVRAAPARRWTAPALLAGALAAVGVGGVASWRRFANEHEKSTAPAASGDPSALVPPAASEMPSAPAATSAPPPTPAASASASSKPSQPTPPPQRRVGLAPQPIAKPRAKVAPPAAPAPVPHTKGPLVDDL